MYRFLQEKSQKPLLKSVSLLEIPHDDDRVSSFQKGTDYEDPTPEEYTDVEAIFGADDESEDS